MDNILSVFKHRSGVLVLGAVWHINSERSNSTCSIADVSKLLKKNYFTVWKTLQDFKSAGLVAHKKAGRIKLIVLTPTGLRVAMLFNEIDNLILWGVK